MVAIQQRLHGRRLRDWRADVDEQSFADVIVETVFIGKECDDQLNCAISGFIDLEDSELVDFDAVVEFWQTERELCFFAEIAGA